MKKYLFLIIIPFLFGGCEKTYNGIIDSGYNGANYQVSSVNPFDTVFYSQNDSLLLVSITFSSISNLKDVYFDIYSSVDSKLNNSPIILYDNGNIDNGDSTKGDKTYSNFYPLSKYDPVGTYKIHYFVIDNNNYTNEVAVKNFVYNNNQNNAAPKISNLVMADSVQAGNSIVFSVAVSDSNGLNDIVSVFYEAYNPDSVLVVNSQGIYKFPMFDDGNTQTDGDMTAGDGIYTVILTFPASVQKGIWTFQFQAKDRGHLLSNKIIHNIKVY